MSRGVCVCCTCCILIGVGLSVGFSFKSSERWKYKDVCDSWSEGVTGEGH